MGTGRCQQQDWDDSIERTRDCGGGKRERGEEMTIVVKGITREALYFDYEKTRLTWSRRLYCGGPVRNCLTKE
jgi:hypothetical protein